MKITNQPAQEGPEELGAFRHLRIVSLSHPVSPRMPHWPGDPPVEFDYWSVVERDCYFLRRFSMGEHGGTHLTAPASYHPNGRTVDEYPPTELVRSAVVIDVCAQCQSDRDYALTAGDLLAWESRHGQVPPNSLTLLNTGWAGRWNDPAAYLGNGADGGLHFPGFSLEAATLLVNDRGAGGLGTDTPGLEPGSDAGLSASRLVLSRPRIVLENLANLDQLPPIGAIVIIGVLKLTGGSGSPAAITAFLPMETT